MREKHPSNFYHWSVIFLGLLVFGGLLVWQGVSVTPWVVLLATFGALSERMVVRLPRTTMTLTFGLVLLALLLGGPAEASLVSVMASLVGFGLLRRQPLKRTLFYVSHQALASGLAGFSYLVGQRLPYWFLTTIHLPALALYTLIYSLLSQGLIWFYDHGVVKTREPALPRTDLLVAFLLTPAPLFLYYLFTIRDLGALLLVLFPLLAFFAAFTTYINIGTTYDEVRLLYEVSQEFMVALTKRETTQMMAQRLGEGMGRMVRSDDRLIYLFLPGVEEFRLLYAYTGDEAPEVITPGEGLLGRIFKGGQATIYSRSAGEPLGNSPPASESRRGALLVAPLLAESVLAGWLVLIRYGRKFSAEELRLVTILSSQAGVLLRNAQLYEESQRLTQVDPLLEVLNRRAFMERAEKRLAQARLWGQKMALVMADLDDFRLVNNLYGHQTGDSVLQRVSEVLRRSVREADLVGRYGGEEFVILLSGTDSDEARRVMERMRGNIEGSRLPGNGELRVTVSAGIALFPEDALDLVSLIRKADQAAYLAKRTGKNRVCFYEEREIHG